MALRVIADRIERENTTMARVHSQPERPMRCIIRATISHTEKSDR